MGPISVSRVRQSGQPQNLVGRYTPTSQHQTGIVWDPNSQLGPVTMGQKWPIVTQNGAPLVVTNYRVELPMERLGPQETQHGAGNAVGHFGPAGAVLPTPTPILGSLCTKTLIWSYLRVSGSDRTVDAPRPPAIPHFVWVPHLFMARTHSWTRVLAPAVLLAAWSTVMGWGSGGEWSNRRVKK